MFCGLCGKQFPASSRYCHHCGSLSVGPTSEQTTVNIQSTVLVRSTKNPGVAAVLSFLLAGAGQIYNGQIGKGVLFLLGIVISWSLTVILIGILPLFVLTEWSVFDAYRNAEKIQLREISSTRTGATQIDPQLQAFSQPRAEANKNVLWVCIIAGMLVTAAMAGFSIWHSRVPAPTVAATITEDEPNSPHACLSSTTIENSGSKLSVSGRLELSPNGTWLLAADEPLSCQPVSVWLHRDWDLDALIGKRIRITGILDVDSSPYWSTPYTVRPSTLEVLVENRWVSHPLVEKSMPAAPPAPSTSEYEVQGSVLLGQEKLIIRVAKDLATGASLDARKLTLASFWLNGGRDFLAIECPSGFEVRSLIGVSNNGNQ